LGGASGHALTHRSTRANRGAHGRTWSGPGSAPTDIFRETRPRVHNGKARSSRSAEPACGDPRSASPAPFVELQERQRTAQLPNVEGCAARGERHDVIGGQVGSGVGGTLVARAPMAMFATPRPKHSGAEALPGPGAVQGVVAAAVRQPGMDEAPTTGSARDDAADGAELHAPASNGMTSAGSSAETRRVGTGVGGSPAARPGGVCGRQIGRPPASVAPWRRLANLA
jgi:hypothetical protein